MTENRPAATSRRSREDWTAVALEALAEGGVAAVAVEPLAARLGATKGSAYWHFKNRDDLLRGALERWEAEHTEAVIDRIAARPDPRERLRALFATALGDLLGNAVEAALQNAAHHPVVAPALQRVTERRIGYLTTLYTRLGFPPARARRRALLAYTAYLGHIQLHRSLPALLPGSAARRAYLDQALGVLTAPTADQHGDQPGLDSRDHG